MNAPTPRDDWAFLLSVYGGAFLGYVLNCGSVAPASPPHMSAPMQEVLRFLISQADSLRDANPDDQSGFARHAGLAGFSNYIPEMGTSLANFLRKSAGGSVPEVSHSTDPVFERLVRLAADVWPIYLLPPPSVGPRTFWMSSPLGIYQHPGLTPLAEAMVADEVLTKLFPTRTDKPLDSLEATLGFSALIYKNGGSGGSLQLIGVIGSLISDAVFRSYLSTGSLNWESLKMHLRESLKALRSLAKLQVTRVPVIVGLQGLRIPDGLAIDIAGGTLRAPRQVERDLLLASTPNVTAIFETSFPLKILSIKEHVFDLSPDPTFTKLLPQMEEASRSFQRTLDLLRLSLLLGSKVDEPLLAAEVSRFVTDPLSHGGQASWNQGSLLIVSHEVNVDQVEGIVDCYRTLVDKHPASLDVGMRRILSATTNRTDPADAFVDAVIVWENMFGVSTETTFRVTGAVAKLLEVADVVKRTALQDELKKAYEKRSRLVHGGVEPKAAELNDMRTRALEIALDCFRKLYRDRPDLLALPSADRGKMLLLE